MESRALRSLKGERARVVATGGGMPLKAGNRAWMKRHGVVVYLKLSPERIASRLSQAQRKKRPLLAGGLASLRKLAKERAKYYVQAHIMVLAAEPPDRIASRILLKIQGKMPRVLHDKTAR
jgi:shikimate kinase